MSTNGRDATEQSPTRPLMVGQRVEVWNSLGVWARGFEIAGIWHNVYILRRVSDRRLLPKGFPASLVRGA